MFVSYTTYMHIMCAYKHKAEIEMAGDSRTGFHDGAFTVGAIGGATTIAGAMVAGARNAAAIRRARDALNVVHGRDEMIRSLQRRVDNQRAEIGRRDATIRDQAMTIRELGLRLTMVQYLRQRGR
jgi:hypothetical protein